jgi:hypothetical protein
MKPAHGMAQRLPQGSAPFAYCDWKRSEFLAWRLITPSSFDAFSHLRAQRLFGCGPVDCRVRHNISNL